MPKAPRASKSKTHSKKAKTPKKERKTPARLPKLTLQQFLALHGKQLYSETKHEWVPWPDIGNGIDPSEAGDAVSRECPLVVNIEKFKIGLVTRGHHARDSVAHNEAVVEYAKDLARCKDALVIVNKAHSLYGYQYPLRKEKTAAINALLLAKQKATEPPSASDDDDDDDDAPETEAEAAAADALVDA